jgi:DNA primase
MMKYPKDYLDEIRLRVKVSQVVGKTVQLKKRGKEFVGLSPFKNEKSPSFTVSDEKGFYHCFSSGEHGNIFDFLMKTKSIGFGEAVRILALEAGMQPYKFSNFDEKKEKRFNNYKDIFKNYSELASTELFKKENIDALRYLETRGLNKKLIQDFKLGFVPWKSNFYETLKKKFNEEEIKLTGLFYCNEKTGKFIDRFNSRIIFPINNLKKETIAFGGRIIRENKRIAKYINSPETEFYKKGRILFNLDNALSERNKTNEVVIVEGYMDVLGLQSAGIKNVVSNSGIAITESQIELIWKFFSNPIVCLDGDESGQSATLRAAERLIPLINENNKIYFSVLPPGNDPDDFIRKKGKEEFKNLLKSKEIIQTFIWKRYLKDVDQSNPFSISKFEKKLKNLCFTIKDETLRKYILENYLKNIRELTPLQNNNRKFYNYQKKHFKILNETKKLHKQKDRFSREQIKENSILFIMIQCPEIVKLKIEELSELNFSHKENNDLKEEIIKLMLSQNNLTEIKSKISNSYTNLILDIERNSILKNILYNKNNDEKGAFLNELIQELREMNHLKKIEILESKAAKNLDENSYSELIKLKSQLNGE